MSIANVVVSLLSIVLACIFVSVYAWSFYNLPILAAGVRRSRRSRRKTESERLTRTLPVFSIVVPVRNEGRVIARLLNALADLDYPDDRKEFIIVEDGSSDGSLDVCRGFAEASGLDMKVLHRPSSDGKSSALNFGVKAARGEIVGVFDADSVPERCALLNVCRYFADQEVAAVQGRTMSINSEENMLTKFVAIEEAVWCEAYLHGKDALGLFVHLKGSCQFIRKSVLDELEGFDEKTLSEDMELSARLTERGHKIRYASDVRSWQETPASVKQLLGQRTRWFRGTMEVAFKYGRLMAKPSLRRFDAEATLYGPFVLITSLLTYFVGFFSFLVPFPLSAILQVLMRFTVVGTTVLMLVSGLALVYISKPRKIANLMWLPFVYLYWCAQTFVATFACLLILLKRPGKWVRTEKNGVVSNAAFR